MMVRGEPALDHLDSRHLPERHATGWTISHTIEDLSYDQPDVKAASRGLAEHQETSFLFTAVFSA